MTQCDLAELDAYQLLLSLVLTLACLLLSIPFQLVGSHASLQIQQLKRGDWTIFPENCIYFW